MIHQALLAFPLLAPCADPGSARNAYESFVRLAATPESQEFLSCFSVHAAEAKPEAERSFRIERLAGIMTEWPVVDVRERDDLAAVEVALESDRREILLVVEGGSWKLASHASYLVEGLSSSERTGRKPVELELATRTENGPYGASAFSFAYVTSDPAECANRVDVWFCHNGDLHATSGSMLTELGKKRLGKIERIPLTHEWKDTVRVRRGVSYVLHCSDGRDRDFFVKFTVKRVRLDGLELEWTLLTEGRGVPRDLVGPHAIAPDTAPDGWDGLCGKDQG